MRARRLSPFVSMVVVLVAAPPAPAVTIDWVLVGDPGNAPDFPTNCVGPGFQGALDCGSVPYEYAIAKYEVTNAQYAEFLNAKATSDPLALYNPQMESSARGGIVRSGAPGDYAYAVKPGFENKPVNFVSFFDALRFANWLHNGQGSGDTETGAYTLLGGTAEPDNYLVARNEDAIVFLPSENEWYKAAYYGGGGVYFAYPVGADLVTDCSPPNFDEGSSANCRPITTPPTPVGGPTDVGAYALSPGPWGTFDQGGNVREWNEQVSGGTRGIRGGAFVSFANILAASAGQTISAGSELDHDGFRVARLVPEPGVSLLGLASFAALAVLQRQRGKAS